MCKCVRSWETNKSIEGVHSSRPIFCDEYIASLEDKVRQLEQLVQPDADSLRKVKTESP